MLLSPPPKKNCFGFIVFSFAGPAGQISSRIEKMRDVLVTIERQLASTILAGKLFEDLEAQSVALDTMHQVC
jgi:hypothetical protein